MWEEQLLQMYNCLHGRKVAILFDILLNYREGIGAPIEDYAKDSRPRDV